MPHLPMLFGKPIHFSDKVPSLGKQGDLELVNPVVTIVLTPDQFSDIHKIMFECDDSADTERVEEMRQRIAVAVGPELATRMEAARALGQRIVFDVEPSL